jgi:hypothetical protein
MAAFTGVVELLLKQKQFFLGWNSVLCVHTVAVGFAFSRKAGTATAKRCHQYCFGLRLPDPTH